MLLVARGQINESAEGELIGARGFGGEYAGWKVEDSVLS